MESGQEGKDFFQPFFLDPPDPEQFPGVPESSVPAPFRHDRGRSRVGDPGDPGKLPRSGTVDIDPVSQQIFLANPEWSPSRGVHCGRLERICVGTVREENRLPRGGTREIDLDRPEPRGADIPDQYDQG